MSTTQRTAMLQLWVDQAAIYLWEGKPAQAENCLRCGMAFVRDMAGQVAS